MSNIFQQQTHKRIPKRNNFDLSHERKFSMNMGKLTPILCHEVLPNDTLKLSSQFLMRFAPMLAPIMHKVDVYTHFFFVPNRILWDGFKDFINGGEDGEQNPAHPYVKVNSLPSGSIGDFMGLPLEYYQQENISALPLAAYTMIYDEYYRDQNLIEPINVPLVDGDNSGLLNLDYSSSPLNRAWEHDYFTSCLPFTQKGDDVQIAISSEGLIPISYDYNSPDVVIDNNGSILTSTNPVTDNFFVSNGNLYSSISQNLNIDNSDNLFVDLQATNLITVNELRQAIALQQYLELNARGGTRYVETLMSHFGVKSSDARLQRPEYLGGGKSHIAISEVLQTSQSETTPQGNMAGHGISTGESHEFNAYFEEWGYVIGIMSVMPKTQYMQGLPRHFQRFDKLDYYWESFAKLGEQAVYNKELYAKHSQPDGIFGYLPRYSEYKFVPNTAHGDFRTSLLHWHLGRIFEDEPALNEGFITCKPSDRIFAVIEDDLHHIWVHMYNSMYSKRLIPYFSVPSGLV